MEAIYAIDELQDLMKRGMVADPQRISGIDADICNWFVVDYPSLGGQGVVRSHHLSYYDARKFVR